MHICAHAFVCVFACVFATAFHSYKEIKATVVHLCRKNNGGCYRANLDGYLVLAAGNALPSGFVLNTITGLPRVTLPTGRYSTFQSWLSPTIVSYRSCQGPLHLIRHVAQSVSRYKETLAWNNKTAAQPSSDLCAKKSPLTLSPGYPPVPPTTTLR